GVDGADVVGHFSFLFVGRCGAQRACCGMCTSCTPPSAMAARMLGAGVDGADVVGHFSFLFVGRCGAQRACCGMCTSCT
ncbi:hypothetical protein CTI14_69020, partial [Methylobacterium radiotolerans]